MLQVYPRVSHKAGIGIATAAGRFGSLLLPLIAAAMNDEKHKSLAAIPFAVKILLSGVCALKLHVETEWEKWKAKTECFNFEFK